MVSSTGDEVPVVMVSRVWRLVSANRAGVKLILANVAPKAAVATCECVQVHTESHSIHHVCACIYLCNLPFAPVMPNNRQRNL